jgi:hypothetical protein
MEENRRLLIMNYFELLLDKVKGDFDISEISKIAYKIYLDHGREFNKNQDDMLMSLIVLSEGEEFELSKDEIILIIDKLVAST